jgi:hypothetical protein
MKSSTKICAILAVAVILCTTSGGRLFGRQDATVKADLPVLVTSCGQSPGPTTLKVVLQRLKLDYTIDPLATPATLEEKSPGGAAFKTLIIVMGASLKGMGAAGISMDDELARAAELIEAARANGVKIIGAHVEGMKRRAQGAAAGDTTDEQSIDAVAPNSDLLLIYKEGNSDGRFTTIAQAKGLPMIEVEKTMDLIPALESLFAK